MNRQTPLDEIEKIENKMEQLEMARYFVCPNCGNLTRLSMAGIIKEFSRKRIEAGKSKKEILDELRSKRQEIKDELH